MELFDPFGIGIRAWQFAFFPGFHPFHGLHRGAIGSADFQFMFDPFGILNICGFVVLFGLAQVLPLRCASVLFPVVYRGGFADEVVAEHEFEGAFLVAAQFRCGVVEGKTELQAIGHV
jgi:hypothetical protein